MISESCSNPQCDGSSIGGVRNHWVQIEEIQLVGQLQGDGPQQRRFAAVTCSKRCAVEVLVAAADIDDAVAARESERRSRLFAQP